MEIAKIFQNASLRVIINIGGTEEEPLFQAIQIGTLLGITDIRHAIEDFDDDEKVAYSKGGLCFLTELGLNRLLCESRAPVARPFQKWVAKVVKEIRVNGKFELEQQWMKDAATSEEELRKQAEEAIALAAAKEEELLKIRTKIYEELPKLDNVYVSKEVAELASDAHKVGKAIDPKKREAQLNTGSAQGSRMIYTCATHNAKIVEDIVKVAQRRYHIASIGGCEHYNNNIEHSVDVIDIAATVVDTLASSFEYMKRYALFSKVIDKLIDFRGVDEAAEDEGTTLMPEANPALLKAAEFVEKYVDFNPVRTKEAVNKQYYAWLVQKDLLNHFWTWFSEDDSSANREFRKNLDKNLNKKSSWKAVLQRAMEAQGRRVKTIHPVVDGLQTNLLAYDRVSWVFGPA
ncbi:hypothetical protein TSOC_012551 [Tetrabaena socialis]|uniref:Bro-N domain-containing protein n=1 Tax=Tetrabaena socialis TaxID=47790 RepID=A0A2J7ZMQ6_9CHLO|nr:hypothetical protein TSOC_012551 [Tetrabaena socialis]|eukprot:PNH01553.1 hypothetical protein TSOC_012551 [Tetrabaena socialis]